jgi:hypothetical protein
LRLKHKLKKHADNSHLAFNLLSLWIQVEFGLAWWFGAGICTGSSGSGTLGSSRSLSIHKVGIFPPFVGFTVQCIPKLPTELLANIDVDGFLEERKISGTYIT